MKSQTGQRRKTYKSPKFSSQLEIIRSINKLTRASYQYFELLQSQGSYDSLR